MPLLRTLTTKIKTAISPSTSPATSPTSPHVSSSSSSSSFERVSGRKEDSFTVKRPETYVRMDSFMTHAANPSKETIGLGEKKRRMSRFREELDVGYE